ncbi:fibronectin type III domain-containing protein [Streptomyces sp. NPDC088766]|uniref:fibronectin type III domain-containing protein n=1 Tax=Streptomyces sp. NPDC088766 TaxID=3365893 RepID=UPI00381EE715
MARREERDGDTSVKVAGTTGTSQTITSLQSDTTYTFTVKARDAAGNLSPGSPTATVRTAARPGTLGCGTDNGPGSVMLMAMLH